MVKQILEGAGFVLNTTYRETRFIKPPTTTYAVYSDTIARRGADDLNLLAEHEISIELYEYTPDPGAEKKIEAQFDALGLEFTKEPRYWINEEQLYQVIYDFSYVKKGDL